MDLEARYNAKCAEVNQQRDHFAQREREFERYERLYRQEIKDLRLKNTQLQNVCRKLTTRLNRAKDLARQLNAQL